jgi:predicted dehydrogenase
MARLKIGLVGVGGFGQVLLKYIFKLQDEGRLDLSAVCDIHPETFPSVMEGKIPGMIRTHSNYDRFLNSERQLDAIMIATPIPLHVEMGIKAMEAGYNAMLEKPPALTLQDIDRMIDLRKRTGKVFAIGFQHTSEQSFVCFSKLIRNGMIGKIKTICAAGLWKRSRGYFTRSAWVGKLLLNGKYVLDGTMNNPFSHLLMNCLILSGLQDKQDVSPKWVQAELYHANDIESEDTSCLRAKMDNDIEILYWASICGQNDDTPFIMVEGTHGKALWDYDGRINHWDSEGQLQSELTVKSDRRYDHLVNFTDFLTGRTNGLSCPLEATRKFVLTANLAFESAGKTRSIDEVFTEKRDGQGQSVDQLKHFDDFLCIKNIGSIMKTAVKSKRLFSEMGVEWATGTEPFHAAGYREFKLFQ